MPASGAHGSRRLMSPGPQGKQLHCSQGYRSCSGGKVRRMLSKLVMFLSRWNIEKALEDKSLVYLSRDISA